MKFSFELSTMIIQYIPIETKIIFGVNPYTVTAEMHLNFGYLDCFDYDMIQTLLHTR